jgi:transposase-like protein
MATTPPVKVRKQPAYTKSKPVGRPPKPKTIKAAPVGRPSGYQPEYAEQAYKLCLLGMTNVRLAELFDVNQDTLYQWKLKYPEFAEALENGREKADAEIAKSLFHRAKGYSHPEVDIKVVQGQIVQTKITKHYPPDTAAASLWLRNRNPTAWKDKVEQEITGPDGGPMSMNLTVTFVKP